MLRLSWAVVVAALAVSVVIAERQPVDVDPVVKGDHPDFERSVLDRASTRNKNSTQDVQYLFNHPHIAYKTQGRGLLIDKKRKQPRMNKAFPNFDDTGNGPPVAASGGEIIPTGSGSGAKDKTEGDVNFMHAFVAALSMIIVTELGDKTFFIAAIMAMNHPRLTVFAGAMSALAIMHVLSAMFGYVITWIPRVYTFYASSALFAIFGLKMLREGWNMKPDEGQEEFEEVQSDLRRREDDERNENPPIETVSVSVQMTTEGDGEVTLKEEPVKVEMLLQKEPLEEGGAGLRGRGVRRNRILAVVSRVFWQALTLTFLAEWGDRSQIATVVMAAREDVYGVIVGGLLGHFLCTGLGVLGGRMIATKISVRTVTIIGGVTFLIFALSAVIMGP